MRGGNLLCNTGPATAPARGPAGGRIRTEPYGGYLSPISAQASLKSPVQMSDTS